jgi:hypothetical protein
MSFAIGVNRCSSRIVICAQPSGEPNQPNNVLSMTLELSGECSDAVRGPFGLRADLLGFKSHLSLPPVRSCMGPFLGQRRKYKTNPFPIDTAGLGFIKRVMLCYS